VNRRQVNADAIGPVAPGCHFYLAPTFEQFSAAVASPLRIGGAN
jgi:hypothetical protein